MSRDGSRDQPGELPGGLVRHAGGVEGLGEEIERLLDDGSAATAGLAALRPSVPCRACGTALTDPISVAAQIGPCCARKTVAA
jgi:hypothetical protein